jgi:hypothetical protein
VGYQVLNSYRTNWLKRQRQELCDRLAKKTEEKFPIDEVEEKSTYRLISEKEIIFKTIGIPLLDGLKVGEFYEGVVECIP